MKAAKPVWVLLFLLFLPLMLGATTVSPGDEGLEEGVALDLKADAALLMEVGSGILIWEMNSHEKLYPASLTKIMSLLLVMEYLEQGRVSLDEMVEVSARASSMGGSEIFLSEGDRVSLENLITAMAVGSANDAAVAVAEHIAGSVEEFVELMNARARTLGLENTHFCNPNGLHHPDHFSTARDVARMSLALLQYPQIHHYATIWMDEHFLKDQIRSGEVYLSNTNRMILFYQGCDGLKTGYTREAGNGIAATARRGHTRFLAVVLGSPTTDDRYEAAQALLDYGFGRFKSLPVLEKGTVVAKIPVEKGDQLMLEVVSPSGVTLFLNRGEPEEFQTEIKLPRALRAPLVAGEKVGEMVVHYGEGRETVVDLVAEEAVSRAKPVLLFERLCAHWLHFGR